MVYEEPVRVRYHYYRSAENQPLITLAMVEMADGQVGYGWAILGKGDTFFRKDYERVNVWSQERYLCRGGQSIARDRALCAIGNPKRGVQIADGVWRYKRSIHNPEALRVIEQANANSLLALAWNNSWKALPLSMYAEPFCHAQKDGDCTWAQCPQLRDGEPMRTSRACPLLEVSE